MGIPLESLFSSYGIEVRCRPEFYEMKKHKICRVPLEMENRGFLIFHLSNLPMNVKGTTF